MIVVDASAILAILQNEAGADVAAAYMRGGLLGAVNLTETLAKMSDVGLPLLAMRDLIKAFDLTIVPFADILALTAAELRPATRYMKISLADRACLALAIDRRLPVLTADSDWAKLDVGIDIRLIR